MNRSPAVSFVTKSALSAKLLIISERMCFFRGVDEKNACFGEIDVVGCGYED